LNGDGIVNFQDYAIASQNGWNVQVRSVISQWLETDMANNYLSFNGASSYVTLADSSALNVGTGDFSVSIAVYPVSLAGAVTYTVVDFFDEDTNRGWKITLDGLTQKATLLVYDTAVTKSVVSAALTTDTWNFIAFTIDRDGNGIPYLASAAGTPISVATASGTLSNPALPKQFGALRNDNTGLYSDYHNGYIDDFRLYASVLTTGEIAEIYNLGVGRKYAALSTGKVAAAAFQFDEGVGSYTLDSIGGLLGTLTGCTWASGGVQFATTTSIEQSIYSLLTNDASVTALTSTRIYPAIVPEQAAMPAITYQQISGDREHDFDDAIGYATGRFQINCWDDSYGGARVLANAVRQVLDGFTGTSYGLYVHHIFLMDEGDMPEIEPELNSTRIRYGKRLDFEITWAESI